MAKVVFSLTSVQVTTLCLVARRGRTSTRRDHTDVLVEKGWIARIGESNRWKLTRAGRAIVAMIRALKLHRSSTTLNADLEDLASAHKVSQASGPEKGGP